MTRTMTPNTKKKGRRKGRKKHSGSDILYTVAIIIFALIFLVSGGMLLKRYLDDRQLESDMAELSSLIDDTAATGESDAAEDNSAKFAACWSATPTLSAGSALRAPTWTTP